MRNTGRRADALQRWRARAKRPFTRTPHLFDGVARMRAHDRERLARPGSSLVIEGYPRSANTFTVVAFLDANGPQHHLGHHLHAAAHLLRAARLDIPAICLVREPLAAAASYLIRRPQLSARDALREYVDFYRTAWGVRTHFVIGPFEEVVSDFGGVIARVNVRFGTRFARYEHSQENDARCFAEVERRNRRESGGRVLETHVARPSELRTARRETVTAALEAVSGGGLLADAHNLYRAYQQLAEVQRRALEDPASQR